MAALATTCKGLVLGVLVAAAFTAWGVAQALTPTFRTKVHVVPTVTLKQAQLLAGDLAAGVPATIGGELRLPPGATERADAPRSIPTATCASSATRDRSPARSASSSAKTTC